jgi:hypothetical protein
MMVRLILICAVLLDLALFRGLGHAATTAAKSHRGVRFGQ